MIRHQLQNPLASRLLEGTVRDGDPVKVSAAEGGLIIDGELVEAA